MDPFDVVQLAGDAVDRCRRHVQQYLHGHRGLAGEPLHRSRRTPLTGADLLTDRHLARLEASFAGEPRGRQLTGDPLHIFGRTSISASRAVGPSR